MILVKIIHNNKTLDLLDLKFDFPKISFLFLNDDFYKEKKKSIIIKTGCGTKLTPFCSIYKKGELIKCFYSETKDCTYENIKQYLNELDQVKN